MGKGVELIFGPPGQPLPGVPTAKAVARKLGFADPFGKSAQFAMYKTSYPAEGTDVDLYPALREEMVNRLAEK